MSDFEELASASEDGYAVTAPTGAVFNVNTPDEVAYFDDRATRYQADNHFINISDLQDLDRLLVMEVMCWRWGVWLSQEKDYWGNSVDLVELKKNLFDYSKELRLLKKALGIDKAARDRDKGESFADYLENLKLRAKEFGVMREQQLTKALTLFHELAAILKMHDNCDDEERREQNVETKDVLEWIRDIAIPEFHAIDAYFQEHQQKFWVRSL